MAKVKNPLLSLDARGTLAKSITFTHRHAGSIVQLKPVSVDRKSTGQLLQRAVFTGCVEEWLALSEADKSSWRVLSSGKNQTGYSLFMQGCLAYIPPVPPPVETKYEYWDGAAGVDTKIYATSWNAQSFTPQIGHDITKLVLRVQRSGNVTGFTFTVSIQGVDGSGHPDGVDLVSFSLPALDLPSILTWEEFVFPTNPELTALTMYAIVMRMNGGSSTRTVIVRRASGNPYPRGERLASSNSGATWTPQTGYDCNFEEWGYPS